MGEIIFLNVLRYATHDEHFPPPNSSSHLLCRTVFECVSPFRLTSCGSVVAISLPFFDKSFPLFDSRRSMKCLSRWSGQIEQELRSVIRDYSESVVILEGI